MTAQVISIFPPCHQCGKPSINMELCQECEDKYIIYKSIARNIRNHIKNCKNKGRCFLCNSYDTGYTDAVEYIRTGGKWR